MCAIKQALERLTQLSEELSFTQAGAPGELQECAPPPPTNRLRPTNRTVPRVNKARAHLVDFDSCGPAYRFIRGLREQEQAVKESPSMRLGIDLQRYTRGSSLGPVIPRVCEHNSQSASTAASLLSAAYAHTAFCLFLFGIYLDQRLSHALHPCAEVAARYRRSNETGVQQAGLGLRSMSRAISRRAISRC